MTPKEKFEDDLRLLLESHYEAMRDRFSEDDSYEFMDKFSALKDIFREKYVPKENNDP